MKTWMIATGLVAATLVGVAGLGHVAARPGDAPKGEAGPAQILVVAVRSRDATITQQYACRIKARRQIELRAAAEGQLVAISAQEGQAVKKGDALFEIGPVLFAARLNVETADRDIAQRELNNIRQAGDRKFVSRDEVTISEAKLAKAQARVDLAAAELNLTRVRAPFDGQVSRPLRQEGSFVLKGEPLATLADNSVMSAYFDVPESRYLEAMAEPQPDDGSPAVELLLADRRKLPHPGKIGAIEAQFNAELGTIAHRADFPNPDGRLRNGQTGTVLINRVLKDAIVIPQRATFETAGVRYVYVVDAADVARRREIIIRAEADDEFVVKSGIAAGERMVTDGVGQVRDGEVVK